MNERAISQECHFSTCMFKWVNSVIDFVRLNKEMGKLGIKNLEDKIKYAQDNISVRQKCLESNKMFKRLK